MKLNIVSVRILIKEATMNILSLIVNNPMMVVIGLVGLTLIATADWLSRTPKVVRQPVRINWDRKK